MSAPEMLSVCECCDRERDTAIYPTEDGDVAVLCSECATELREMFEIT